MPTPPHGHSKVEVKDRPLANDFMPDEEFGRMLLAWFGNIARVLEHGRVSYIWGAIVTAGTIRPRLTEERWSLEHWINTPLRLHFRDFFLSPCQESGSSS